MIYLFFFLTITSLVYAVFLFFQERRQGVQRRISLITDSVMKHEPLDEPSEQEPSGLKIALRAMWRRLRRRFKRRISEERELKIELKLLRAGSPMGMGPFEYRIFQVVIMILLPVALIGYTLLIGMSSGGILLFGIFGFVLSLILPSYYLSLKTKQRSRLALRELPDVLDLLTVSLEAGLGFDAALGKLIAKSDGVLSFEFRRCLEEIRLGKSRREALLGVRERIDLDSLKVVIGSILQAEKLGIGLVQVLRVQSQEIREQRKQRAEEEAMKAPIKIMFPLVLFIFPSLFIVLLGPAILQFIETFSK